MPVVLKDEIRTARKQYKCDAYAWFNNCNMGRDDLTPKQQPILDAAEKAGGVIKPGDRYRYQRGVWEGSMYTLRMHIGMDDVCRVHGLYGED